MSTNSNVSSGRIKALPLYGILLVVGLILALLIINPPSINLSAPAVPVAEPSPARGRAADTARWNGMAGNYIAGEAANLARGRAADTARLNGRVGAYAASPAGMADNLARSRAADSVRWNAMAKSLYASLGT